MPEYTYATLQGYDKNLSQGEVLIDATVTIGQNDLSSTTTLVVADPKGGIAQALINHSLLNGGIQKLEKPSDVAANTTTPPGMPGAAGQVPGGDGGNGVVVGADPRFTPEIKAFMDLIAYKEVPIPLGLKGYYANNGVSGNMGYFTDDQIKNGFPYPYLSPLWNVGRYQFSYDEYKEVTANAGNNVKGYTPIDQDYMCYWRMNQKGCIDALKRGDIRSAIARGGIEWASLPGSIHGQVQAGYTVDQAVAYYNQRLAYYKGGTQPPAKVDPTAAAPTAAPVTTSTENAPPIKGNKLTVYIGDSEFGFYHQSTEFDADTGKTTIGGQSIRYALDRRKRSRVVHDIGLKDFAQTIADSNKVKLDWQAPDIKFTAIDQRGISDYAVLLQQAKQSGLFVSDNKDTITVKPLSAVQDSGLVFKWRYNIISAKFKDEALDGTKEDKSSALLQGESKSSLDPASGNIVQSKPDIDKVADSSTTGNKAPAVGGQPVPGQEVVQAQARSRVKRVQGLPTTLVVPLNESTLALKPLDTIKTEEFQDVLNRIWVINDIKHEPFKGVTTLNIYSPIEVLSAVQDAVTPPGAPVTSTAPIGQAVGGYIYPATNTSPFTNSGQWHNNRGNHLHAGVDFAGGSGGGAIVSIANGVVTWANSTGDRGGYGHCVDVDHGNGVCSRYAHMDAVSVKTGQQVTQGAQLGTVGNTGHSFGAHLHFETFKKGHEFGSDTIKPDTLPGLSRCGIVGQSVTVGKQN